MAKRAAVGFESQRWQTAATSVNATPCVEVWKVTTNCTFSNNPVKTGTYALRANVTGTGMAYVTLAPRAANGEYTAAADDKAYVGKWLRPSAMGAATAGIISALDSSEAVMGHLGLNSSRQLVVMDSSGSTLATGTNVLATTTFYYVEVLFDKTNGQISAYLNGVQEIAPQSLTFANQIAYIRIGKTTNANSTCDLFSDDVIWDSAEFNTFGEVYIALPNADGTYTQWTSGTYASVDERPHDGASTVLSGSGNSADKVSVGFQDASTVGFSTKTIVGIQSIMLSGRGTASTTDIIKEFIKSGATEVLASSFTIPGTATTMPLGYTGQMYETDPATGAPWTISGFDAVEIGAEIQTGSSGGGSRRITAIYLMVAVVPKKVLPPEATASAAAPLPAVIIPISKTVAAVEATAGASALLAAVTYATPSTVSAVEATASAAAQLATIAALRQTAITGVLATAAAAALLPTITDVGNVAIAGSLSTASAVAPLPVIAAFRVTLVAGILATASAAAPLPTVVAFRQTTVSGVQATATAAAPLPDVVDVGNTTVAGTQATATAAAPLPAAVSLQQAAVAGIAATASAVALLPDIADVANPVIAGSVATAMAEALLPTITGAGLAAIAGEPATATAMVYTISFSTSPAVAGEAAAATASSPLPTVAIQPAPILSPVATASAAVQLPTVSGAAIIAALAATAGASALLPLLLGQRLTTVLAVLALADAEAYASSQVPGIAINALDAAAGATAQLPDIGKGVAPIALPAAADASAMAEVALSNPGFEVDTSSWTIRQGNETLTRITSWAHDGVGAGSLLLSTNSAAAGAFHPFAGVPGGRYTATMWVRPDAGVIAQIWLWDDVGGFTSGGTFTGDGTSEAQISVTAVMSASATAYRVYIRCQNGAQSGKSIAFDSVKVAGFDYIIARQNGAVIGIQATATAAALLPLVGVGRAALPPAATASAAALSPLVAKSLAILGIQATAGAAALLAALGTATQTDIAGAVAQATASALTPAIVPSRVILALPATAGASALDALVGVGRGILALPSTALAAVPNPALRIARVVLASEATAGAVVLSPSVQSARLSLIVAFPAESFATALAPTFDHRIGVVPATATASLFVPVVVAYTGEVLPMWVYAGEVALAPVYRKTVSLGQLDAGSLTIFSTDRRNI